jgi:hypothetical protein
MSLTITIKCLFPKNQYLLRKVKVTSANGKTFKVGYLETITINDVVGFLEFKLDYHRFRLPIDSVKCDSKVIVYLKHRKKFPFYITDIMFKNALFAEIVDDERFATFEQNYVNTIPIKPFSISPLKIACISVAFSLNATLLYISIATLDKTADDRNFVFVLAMAGIITLVRTVSQRNSITEKMFFLLYSSLAIVALLTSMFLSFDKISNLLIIGQSTLLILLLILEKVIVRIKK